MNSKIYEDMKKDITVIYEMKQDGTVFTYNSSYSIAMYQYLAKIDQFLKMPMDDFEIYFQDFKISDSMVPKNT